MLATVPNSFLAADVNFKVSSEVEPPAPQVKSVNRGPKASVIHVTSNMWYPKM
jgi:hypothetical protein